VSSGPLDALEEPLVQNAGRARQLAGVLCEGGGEGGRSCAWYHGAYPALRLFGLAATPERHAGFYGAALGALAGRPEFARVLVSGAADTAMLAQVLRAAARRAAPAAGAAPPLHIRVVDRCRTPLRLCHGYAAQAGAEIESATLDLLAPPAREPPAEPFDLACTHSLLALVPPPQRPALVAAWRALLRPGGRLVSTVRIDPAPRPPRATPEQAAAFAERARAAAAGAAPALRFDPGELATLALRYAEGLASWPVASREELAGLLEAGGFALERLDVVEVGGRLPGASGGAGTDRSARYAEFVGVRV
jgi:SAM-dependent methyltransferase